VVAPTLLAPAASGRGLSQEKLPAYLGFFQLVHDARHRGKALLGTLVAGLVA
jgi:transposase